MPELRQIVNDFGFNQVFGSSLDPTKRWFAISSKWMVNGRKNDFLKTDALKYWPEEVLEVAQNSLYSEIGGRVENELFGSTKSKDLVVVSTVFGILCQSLRRRNLENDKFIPSPEFTKLRSFINSFDHRSDSTSAILNTPPPTPEEAEGETTVEISNVVQATHPKIGHGVATSLKYLDETKAIGPRIKAKHAGAITAPLLEDLKQWFRGDTNDPNLGSVLGYGFLYTEEDNRAFIKTTISKAISVVAERNTMKKTLALMLTEPVNKAIVESMRVADWVKLYVKLATKLPDRSWQTMLNFLNIGRSGKNIDAEILLTNNEIRAQKAMVFDVTRQTFGVSVLQEDLRGYSVSLAAVLIWAIRESRLHQTAAEVIEFNLKLDGRPLAGREQVSVGVVPIGLASTGNGCQSALSVYPLALANCKENRSEVKKLITRLNEEKRVIKKHGLVVDGKKYTVNFKVTLDLKALLMLLVKKDDENYVLGSRGLDVEFCVFCHALRVCIPMDVFACKEHWIGGYNEVCLTCLQSKANIGSWTGMRDDLLFLFEEDLSSISLCSLHCEMRNTEQLLGSLGLFAYKCGCLDECNQSLANYGPENSRGFDRIRIKPHQGQLTTMTKSNIQVTSFSGNTERSILQNAADIVSDSLPIENVISFFKKADGAGKDVVLGYVAFSDNVKNFLEEILEIGKYTRDYGDRQEEVDLHKNQVLKNFLENEAKTWSTKLQNLEDKFLECDNPSHIMVPKSPPKKKAKRSVNKQQAPVVNLAMVKLAAEVQIDHLKKVFHEWTEIAKVIRDDIFEEDDDDDQLIDIFDVKCKLWGLLLRAVFGVSLGAGDYVHYTVDHCAMLFRVHRSFKKYSNQGFEASHKVHRALYSRSTSHDQAGVTQSLDQILTHWLSEMMLSLRLQFCKASEVLDDGKTSFYYRGCGWPKKQVHWSKDDQQWITVMCQLFEKLYGKDYLIYTYTKEKGTKVTKNDDPRTQYNYDHAVWEAEYEDLIGSIPTKERGARQSSYRQLTDNSASTFNKQSPTINLPDTNASPSLNNRADETSCSSLPDASKDKSVATRKSGDETKGKGARRSLGYNQVPHDQAASTSNQQSLPSAAPLINSISENNTETPFSSSDAANSEYEDPLNISDQNEDIIDLTPFPDTCTASAMPPNSRAACLSSSITRKQFAEIDIPHISGTTFSRSHVKCCFGPETETDPFSLNERPSEAVVTWAKEAFRRKKGARKTTGVRIGHLGLFSPDGLYVLRKYCDIAKVKRQIHGEEKWLEDNDGLSSVQIDAIKEVLFHSPMTKTVLETGHKSIDVESFSNLALERYIDNFTIDTVIISYVKETQESKKVKAVYFPSEIFTWLNTKNNTFILDNILEVLSTVDDEDIELLLIPVHMNECHWGLVLVDFVNQKLMFDDGYKLAHNKSLLSDIKKILELILILKPSYPSLQCQFWTLVDNFERFGMPLQIDSKGTGQGTGSCGIGVILAARDFLNSGPQFNVQFNWQFNDMRRLRKQLCLQILAWAT